MAAETADDHTLQPDGGFTLLEVMVSLFIFSIVGAGMAPAFIAHLRRNTQSEIRTGATAAAQLVLDNIRLLDTTSLPMSGDVTYSESVDSRSFDVRVKYCLVAGYCNVNSTRHMTVEVRYKNVLRFSTETVYTQLR